MDNIKVLMIEDHPMVRMGLALVIEKIGDIDLIAEAEDGLEGVEKARRLLPDVILMDIGLPSIDGIEATKMIKETNPEIQILMFTSRNAEDDVLAAFEAGANGYIMKGSTPEQTASAIKAVSEGTGWLDPAIARIVLSNIQRGNNKPQNNYLGEINYKDGKNIYGLTEREMEVLSLMVEGLSNSQLAERLIISIATAKAHVHSILQKLCVTKRTRAVSLAMQQGLV